jgi:hypothetical protein
MLSRIFFLMLLAVVILSFSGIAAGQASVSETAKTKAKIAKLGVGTDVTVVGRAGKTFHGSIGKVGDDSFSVNEVDLKANVEIRYDQVKRLEKGYTPASPITGHRTSHKTQRIIGFAALGALVVVVVVVISALRNPNF